MALRLGDPTAQRAGRLTLNPLAHCDPLGALMLLLLRFGWAKPVPIDPRYFRRPRRDLALVSLAGVAGNLLTAAVVGVGIRLFPQILSFNWALSGVLLSLVLVNLALAVFNLIPIPPLDGSKLLYPLLPPQAFRLVLVMERWGSLILLVLVCLGVVGQIMGPVVNWLFYLIVIG